MISYFQLVMYFHLTRIMYLCTEYVVCNFLIADPPEYVIKRVIALEGDEVETSAASSVVLKRGAAWVEGDNALNSIDSNTYGPICLGLAVGKASHVVWPPGHLFHKAWEDGRN